MARPEVTVVRTGTANMASVLAAFARLDIAPQLTSDPAVVQTATHVVLPGVGTFGASMQELTQHGLAEALQKRVIAGIPTLAVCVGFQMLFEYSDESPGVRGIGALPGTLRRYSGPVRVPQLGWNSVVPTLGCRTLTPGYAYYANSYCLETPPEGWVAAYSEHGTRFVAALERDGLLLCQFHPELSGAWGRALLERWLRVP